MRPNPKLDPTARSGVAGLSLEERVARLETWAASGHGAFVQSDPIAREFHVRKWLEDIARRIAGGLR